MPRNPQYDVLFEPVQIGPVTSRNRFYQTPQCNGMGRNYPTSMAAMRGVKAEGGWGVVFAEQCDFHFTTDNPRNVRLWDEQDIPILQRMTDRVREHGIRWLRYFRKAHEFGFVVDKNIRALRRDLDVGLLHTLPKEAVALELRAIVTKCRSPGRCLLDLHEVGLLATISPTLNAQFDGRPAGPQRYHPEVSQALHMILAMEWAIANSRHLDERDRAATIFAVLCHDLGKSDTRRPEFPHHNGHEAAGVPHIEELAQSWPGVLDQRTATLCKHVAELHLQVRRFDELRPGTLAKMYDQYFRPKDYPLEPFALAVAADSAGRLGLENGGPRVRQVVFDHLTRLRAACGSVDAKALREQFPDDLDKFRSALHEARTRAIRAAGFVGQKTT